MIDAKTIDAVKAIPITTYLWSRGFAPAHKCAGNGKNDWAYCSPLSGEKTPSFYVSAANTFNDFSTDQRGDNIRLVMLLERVGFADAVRKLSALDLSVSLPETKSFFLSGPMISDSDTVVTGVSSLQRSVLIKYIEDERKIPFQVASRYCSEVHYTANGKQYFGVGFPTDNGGWAVRSSKFKRHVGPMGITTIAGNSSISINLFEGFFDFLSALVYFRANTLANTTIVLNSTANLRNALPTLQTAKTVFCFLDNDKAGKKTVETLQTYGNVFDRSSIYARHADFNDLIRSL